jgi:cytochrome c5
MMRPAFLLLTFFFAFSLQAQDFDKQQIENRIHPVGKVSVEGGAAPAAAPDNSKKSTETAAKAPGQATFEKYCITCHKDGLAGAPKFRDANDWKPRLAAQNLDVLTATAIKGLNAMPPKGTCQECSEEDIRQAIQYMLPKS